MKLRELRSTTTSVPSSVPACDRASRNAAMLATSSSPSGAMTIGSSNAGDARSHLFPDTRCQRHHAALLNRPWTFALPIGTASRVARRRSISRRRRNHRSAAQAGGCCSGRPLRECAPTLIGASRPDHAWTTALTIATEVLNPFAPGRAPRPDTCFRLDLERPAQSCRRSLSLPSCRVALPLICDKRHHRAKTEPRYRKATG
jgi:hypothetical protein